MGSTAYRYWDAVWRDSQDKTEKQQWDSPSSWVEALAAAWRDARVRTVLDLGCGVGRHSVMLSKLGFAVFAVDKSESACVRTRAASSAANVDVEITLGDYRRLPYADGTFDAVLAYNVVYHGNEDDLLACVAEVTRTLRPGGRYASTMLSKRNAEYGKGVEVVPNTFVRPDAQDDKVHPHLYCDATDLVRLHPGLALRGCHDVSQSDAGTYHWYCEFERSGS